jgi:hypothetical protein
LALRNPNDPITAGFSCLDAHAVSRPLSSEDAMLSLAIGRKFAAGILATFFSFSIPCLSAAGATTRQLCPDVPVEVETASPEEHQLTCMAARAALDMLGRCSISAHRPLHVRIMREVRHPRGGPPIFGLFDIAQERVLVTEHANVASLVEDTPFSALPAREFYQSLIVHEVVHGVLHQNYGRQPKSHAAYEYPAYALQVAFLPAPVRDKFLQTFDPPVKASFLFSDTILFFDPFYFAARAYQHFKSAPDGCAHIRALVDGKAEFVALQ